VPATENDLHLHQTADVKTSPMTRSARIHEFGNADVFRIEDIATDEPSSP
jgi:hypothetical protein